MSTRNVKEHLADHLAIRDLIARYTDALNRRDWEAMATQFTADAVWDAGGPAMGEQALYFSGARNIAAGIGNSVSGTSMCVQMTHSTAIEVTGGRATARSTINEVVGLGVDGGMTSLGTYSDELVLEADGEWRFSRRVFRFLYLDTHALPGQVLMMQPAGGPAGQ